MEAEATGEEEGDQVSERSTQDRETLEMEESAVEADNEERENMPVLLKLGRGELEVLSPHLSSASLWLETGSQSKGLMMRTLCS